MAHVDTMNPPRSLTPGCVDTDQPQPAHDPQLSLVLAALAQARNSIHRPSRQSYLIWQAAPAMIQLVHHSQQHFNQLTASKRQDLADLVEAVNAVLADEANILALQPANQT